MTDVQSANGRGVTIVMPSGGEDDGFDYEDSVFQIPERVRADPRYVLIHERMVQNLRQEAAGLEMNTLQMILVERIANGYVLMRWHEDHPGNWAGVNTEKDFVLNWRSLVSEFNKILAAGEDKRRTALRDAYERIMIEGLKMIDDVESRAKVKKFYMDEFADIGD
jgi:hypothetical protein